MTDKTEKKYMVEAINRHWNSDRFETLKEAEDYARTQTHKNGEPQGIFAMIHKTKVPEIVHNVQIEKVQ